MGNCKRIICAILALGMSTGMLSACASGGEKDQTGSVASTVSQTASSGGTGAPAAGGVNLTGFPIVNEPITLKVFGQRDQNQTEWANMLTFQEYEKMTNIKMDFQEVPAQGYDEKKNLLFASNDLPDVFVRAVLKATEVSMYGTESKQLIPLEPLMEQYAPNLFGIMQEKEIVKSSITASDGHVYAIPPMDFSDTGLMGFKQWINQDWLSAVGKEIPTTPQELKDVLIAFRDADPNKNGQPDEIPLGIREPSSIYVLGGSFGLDHQMKDTINIENGQVKYWLTDDRFKEYLTWLHDLYKEKLLWQDYYKNDRPAWRSNLSNAMFGAMYMPYSDVFINVEDQFTGYAPLKGPRGDQLWADANNGLAAESSFAISNTCKYPQAALRWVDYFYSEEGAVFFNYGIEGQTFTFDAAGMPQINADILNHAEGFMTALGKVSMAPGAGGPSMMTNKTDGIVASALTKRVAAEHVPYLPKTVYAKPSIAQEEQERVNTIMQDLTKYRDEAVTKFILGEWSFEKWNEYCATLEQIGLKDLEAIYQSAFDTMQK